ncbi:MAG TPA: TlyA family rRNA (cytidine-2'-O)-methyltransferase [Dehalococcoidia bacterium]|nr:TlyA family rRNA (cytidine-2'-O)-methyltransferase [Dehalococcoidia bacterium]
MPKQRLDDLLVSRNLSENKNKARALIMAGDVQVNGLAITKSGTMVPDDSIIEMRKKLPYVSRGGIKLAHALDSFDIDAGSCIALDIGASTGGFTDCLLQRGAQRVYALDVGYGQIDYKLRQDPRVIVMDRTNAHHPFTVTEKADIVTMDVSFISVTKVIPNVIPHMKANGKMIVLIKPQFEAEREDVGKGGIISDPLIHARVLAKVVLWAIDQKLRVRGLTASPITGAEGNREFLLYLQMQENTKEG